MSMLAPHTVYALRTPDRSETIYVGVTNDFTRRHREHSKRPEFAGSVMCGLGSFASRAVAEEVERRTIRELRPRLNRVQPVGPSVHVRRQERAIHDWAFGELLDLVPLFQGGAA